MSIIAKVEQYFKDVRDSTDRVVMTDPSHAAPFYRSSSPQVACAGIAGVLADQHWLPRILPSWESTWMIESAIHQDEIRCNLYRVEDVESSTMEPVYLKGWGTCGSYRTIVQVRPGTKQIRVFPLLAANTRGFVDWWDPYQSMTIPLTQGQKLSLGFPFMEVLHDTGKVKDRCSL